MLTGGLAGRVRAEVRAAGARIDSLRRIAGFSRRLGEPTTEPELLAEVARQAAGPGRQSVVPGRRRRPGPGRRRTPRHRARRSRLGPPPAGAGTRIEPAGHGTSTLPSAAWLFLPMRTLRGRLGVLGVCAAQGLDEPLLQSLEALADQAAIAIERVRLVNQAARAAALEETQKLRTALLASLGHDLRTPLAGIQGAAGTLRGAWAQLSDDTRADLLASIEDDVGRMARFLTNITDLVRLETGEVRPRLSAVPLTEVTEAALSRLPNALYIATDVPRRPGRPSRRAVARTGAGQRPGQRRQIFPPRRRRPATRPSPRPAGQHRHQRPKAPASPPTISTASSTASSASSGATAPAPASA